MIEGSGTLLGFVPARGGSKKVPKKNLQPLGGAPLVAYAIASARASGIFHEVVVSSDSEDILEVAQRYGATPVRRPEEIAQDLSATEDAMLHCLDDYRARHGRLPDGMGLIQCTSPFRRAAHIRGASDVWRASGADSVMSVSVTPSHFHPAWQKVIHDGRLYSFDAFPPEQLLPIFETRRYRVRQELPGTYYWKNGAVYLVNTEALLETRSRFGQSCAAFVIDDPLVNIDTPDDLEYAEYLLQRGKVPLDFAVEPV